MVSMVARQQEEGGGESLTSATRTLCCIFFLDFMMRTIAASISCFLSSSTFWRVSFLSGSDSPCLAATGETEAAGWKCGTNAPFRAEARAEVASCFSSGPVRVQQLVPSLVACSKMAAGGPRARTERGGFRQHRTDLKPWESVWEL